MRNGMIAIFLVILMVGCASQPPCHSFSVCPEIKFSWTPTQPSPEKKRELEETGMPYVLKATPPYYPRAAWDNNVEGMVVMAFDVTPEGKPINIVVVTSIPKGVFDAAGVEALENSIYTKTENGAAGFHRKFTWSISR
ncbi:TonB family protein [Spongiibacter sp. KMU-158]|uniref:TonB family protein n=1 Tax=Spongiibacter pelagi TaxID=2760804 RepID=A0A927C2Y1_9GAMM|nr:TonB family protein [Spongiibacter pelagi]MBD2860339.1 TonB family protein [Spongiibacter pelagi]